MELRSFTVPTPRERVVVFNEYNLPFVGGLVKSVRSNGYLGFETFSGALPESFVVDSAYRFVGMMNQIEDGHDGLVIPASVLFKYFCQLPSEWQDPHHSEAIWSELMLTETVLWRNLSLAFVGDAGAGTPSNV